MDAQSDLGELGIGHGQIGKPLVDALQRMGYGGILLDAAGAVLLINSEAERLLRAELEANGSDAWAREALKALLRSGDRRFNLHGREPWVAVVRSDGRPLFLHAVQVGDPGVTGPHSVVILLDFASPAEPSPVALRKMFGMTPAETRLAGALLRGQTPDEIAEEHGVRIGTIRSQLAAIYAKTNTRRQGELIALLVRASIMP